MMGKIHFGKISFWNGQGMDYEKGIWWIGIMIKSNFETFWVLLRSGISERILMIDCFHVESTVMGSGDLLFGYERDNKFIGWCVLYGMLQSTQAAGKRIRFWSHCK
jgi:hypothetical protein